MLSSRNVEKSERVKDRSSMNNNLSLNLKEAGARSSLNHLSKKNLRSAKDLN